MLMGSRVLRSHSIISIVAREFILISCGRCVKVRLEDKGSERIALETGLIIKLFQDLNIAVQLKCRNFTSARIHIRLTRAIPPERREKAQRSEVNLDQVQEHQSNPTR